MDKERTWRILDVLRPIAQAHNTGVATIALAWVLAKPFVTSVIIGAKRMEQLEAELQQLKAQLPGGATAGSGTMAREGDSRSERLPLVASLGPVVVPLSASSTHTPQALGPVQTLTPQESGGRAGPVTVPAVPVAPPDHRLPEAMQAPDAPPAVDNDTLPSVSFVKPDALLDGHPASSKLDLLEAMIENMLDHLNAKPKLMAETADVRRFTSSAAFAMHNGTAPIPVWSGQQQRHRLNRGGNRQLNAALHRIAITQIRLGGEARAYVARRISLGNSKTEAIRALRRQLSDEVYRRLRLDHLECLSVTPPMAA